MALWTPYIDEALDLSKPTKKEPSYEYPQEYHYQYPAYSGQVSPMSVVSGCSYESYYQSYKPVALSPPASPNESGFSSPTFQTTRNEDRSYIDVVSYEAMPSYENTNYHSMRRENNVEISRKRSFDCVDDTLSDDPDFQEFERDALRAMAEKNGGALLGNNPRMRRAVRSNNDSSDDSYRKQRERNNYAAKQSRDRRKLREIHLALKVSYLRREVASLKALLAGKVCSRCQQSCRC